MYMLKIFQKVNFFSHTAMNEAYLLDMFENNLNKIAFYELSDNV